MNNSILIIEGLIIGLSLAAPVGPMAMLCIQRTLSQNIYFGIISGTGIAVTDALYGLTAAFGLTMVSDFLITHKMWLGVGGGLFLLYLGWQTIQSSKQLNEARQSKANGYISAFSSALFLTLTNPMTILAYVAIFSGAAISTDGTHSAAFIMTAAIFLGSLSWWVFLCSVVSATKHKLNAKHIYAINIGSGLILVGFALYMLWQAMSSFILNNI